MRSWSSSRAKENCIQIGILLSLAIACMICCHLWYYSGLANVIDLFLFEQGIKSLAGLVIRHTCSSDYHLMGVNDNSSVETSIYPLSDNI